MLTVVYITNRIDPKFQWFLDSLDFQTTAEDKGNLEIIFIDLLVDGLPQDSDRHKHLNECVGGRFNYFHVPPKASSWQGSHRLPSQNWFAASNARNTGIIRARGEHIVFVDDLSVLTGEWWKAVKEGLQKNLVTLGAYRKVKELRVENGNITYFAEFPQGIDNRFQYGDNHGPVNCAGNWLYGCSFACQLEYLLMVNGSDEACDGMGSEDYILGIRLANNGIGFQYDRRMMTYESEEDHHLDKPMRRTDKGVSPNDKSHAILKLAQETKFAENKHFGLEGIRGLRKAFQETGSIPLPIGPTHDWYDGQPISEMT